LTLLVAGAALSAVSLTNSGLKTVVAILGLILLIGSLCLTIFIYLNEFEKLWYGGRAVAESVKTLAWRYMTRAEPFDAALTPKKADGRLTKSLAEILTNRKHLAGIFGGDLGSAPQITDQMREVRSLDTVTRKSIYLAQRIDGQRKWYSNKARDNQRAKGVWFAAVIVSQGLALLAAAFLVAHPDSPVSLTGIFTTLASAFLAWMQLKRNQELAQSYGLAAHELGLIHARGEHVQTEEELSIYVSDAENAISREHTLWVARRDDV